MGVDGARGESGTSTIILDTGRRCWTVGTLLGWADLTILIALRWKANSAGFEPFLFPRCACRRPGLVSRVGSLHFSKLASYFTQVKLSKLLRPPQIVVDSMWVHVMADPTSFWYQFQCLCNGVYTTRSTPLGFQEGAQELRWGPINIHSVMQNSYVLTTWL